MGGRPALNSHQIIRAVKSRAETEIADLPAYLYRVWRRLLLAELEKQNGHRRIEKSFSTAPQQTTDELDRRILLQQVIGQMDDWTRRVFEYLALDFTYDQIAAELGGHGHAIRMKYDRKLQALAQRLNANTGEPK